MAEAPLKPVLQKPPGYRDPGQPLPRPPPRKPVLPPSFQPRRKRRSCFRLVCCFLCIFFLLAVIFFSVSGALFYVLYDPKPPVFHLEAFQIPKFDLAVKSDGRYLTAKTLTRVEIKNPNRKLMWYFEGTEFEIRAGDDTVLGSRNLGTFGVAKKNLTNVKAETEVKNKLLEAGQGLKLKDHFRSKAMVVKVNVRTRAGLVVGKSRVGTVDVQVLCGNMSLKKLSGGEMPKCTVSMFKWIKIE